MRTLKQLTCPRCDGSFSSFVYVEGLVCRPCIEGAHGDSHAWDDETPTQPRIIVPLRLLAELAAS